MSMYGKNHYSIKVISLQLIKINGKKNIFKKCKYIMIKLTKEEKDFYAENYKTLVQKTEDDSKKLKDIPYSWIIKLILL